MSGDLALAQARHWLDVGRPERCLEVLARAEWAGDEPEFLRVRSGAFVELERWDEAVDSARRGLAAEPDDLGLLYLLAYAVEEARADGHQESEKLFLHGLSVDPHNVALLTGYANLLSRFHHLDKAGLLLDRAASVDPEAIEVDLGRAQWAFARGKNREASSWARKALEKEPENTQALALAGMLDSVSGRAATGSQRLRTAATQQLGNRDLATAARHTTLEAHPLMWPVRAMQHLPQPVAVLSGVIVALIASGVSAMGAPVVGVVLLLVWVAFVVYFWLAVLVAHLIMRRRR